LQATRSQRLNHLREALAVCDDSAVWHVGLHRATEGGLSLTSQVIELVNDDNFEALLNSRIKLLSTRNFFNQLLNDYAVLAIGVTGSDLDVEVAAEYHALNDGARGRAGLEFLVLTLDLVDQGRLIELLQQAFSHCALPRTRRAIEEDVREVVTLGNLGQHLVGLFVDPGGALCVCDGQWAVLFDPQPLL